jgi:hypothetical protein
MQFSVHRESAAGVEHREWLADGPGDPRLPLAVALLDACAGASSVVVYSGYENTVIRGVADALPALAHDLHALAARLVDLLPIVRDHVYDSKFEGSFSLKRVLPALVGQGYDDLAIAVGGLASVRLDRLLFRAISDAECADLRRDLLAYCSRDTSGLVLLLGYLRRLAAAHP